MTSPIHHPAPRFDPAPLLRQMELNLPDLRERPHTIQSLRDGWGDGGHKVTEQQIAAELGVSTRALARWRYHGAKLNRVVADRLATRIGMHPALIWDEWYAA